MPPSEGALCAQEEDVYGGLDHTAAIIFATHYILASSDAAIHLTHPVLSITSVRSHVDNTDQYCLHDSNYTHRPLFLRGRTPRSDVRVQCYRLIPDDFMTIIPIDIDETNYMHRPLFLRGRAHRSDAHFRCYRTLVCYRRCPHST